MVPPDAGADRPDSDLSERAQPRLGMELVLRQHHGRGAEALDHRAHERPDRGQRDPKEGLDRPGAASGVFVHSLLEWMAHTGFAAVAANPSALRDRVARGCALRQWPQLIDPLTEQLLAWLHTPLGLPGAPATLAGLGAYQAELEFWFAAQQLPLPALDAHTRAMLLPGLPRPALAADTLNGMLKGFADLVLCHDGRYYVVDYKTNWLGPLRADYAPAALAAPLAESRYDLQAAIYLLALHRHLRERLPDYQCERHLGGALYLFLRGWDGHGHGVWHACPSAAEMDALDQLFAGAPA